MSEQPRSYVPIHIPKSMRWLRGAIDRMCAKTGKGAAALFREAFCERYQSEDAELRDKWGKYKDLNHEE